MTTDEAICRRPLTEHEKEVLEFIAEHPRLTTYDIAENFGHSEDVYRAVAYLYMNLYADLDQSTGAITARKI